MRPGLKNPSLKINLFRDRLRVRQQAVNLRIEVRILVPEPI